MSGRESVVLYLLVLDLPQCDILSLTRIPGVAYPLKDLSQKIDRHFITSY